MDVPKAATICCVTGRPFQPGEVFYSALVGEEIDRKRLDFAAESWTGPPEGSTAWWKSTAPETNEKKVKMAPNDILFNLFSELKLQPENTDMRYVLTLLLIRRRLFRYEREEINEEGQKVLVVYGLKDNMTYEVPVAMPDARRLEEVQNQLSELLYTRDG